MTTEILQYNGNKDKEILKLLCDDGFMDIHQDVRDSVIFSVMQYQCETDESNIARGVIVENQNQKIVGYVGGILQHCQYKGTDYLMCQTTSAFMDKNYPGNLTKTFQKFVENKNDLIYFTIGASNSRVIRSLEKIGCVQINLERFAKEYLLPLNFAVFIEEYTSKKHLLKYILRYCSPVFNRYFKIVDNNYYQSKILSNFDNDYSLVENTYNQRHYHDFVVKWNKDLLKLKFQKRLSINLDNLRENEVFHVAVFNERQQIIGSLVVAKVRRFRKLMIIDLQTIEKDKDNIVLALLQPLKKLNYASLIIFGIEDCYLSVLKKQLHLLHKNTEWKAYCMPDTRIPIDDIQILYSDDDVNY